MIGVVVFALGLPQMFASIDHGDTLDNGVMVTGYVIMRVALVFLWLQVARHDPERAPAARTYAVAIGIAQVGWIAFVFLDLPVATTFACFTVLLAIELLGPLPGRAQGADSRGTPTTSPSATACSTIITLGEVILGTIAALNALVHGEAGWTTDAVLLTVAGVGLCFGCWWTYFAIPWAEPLARHRRAGVRLRLRPPADLRRARGDGRRPARRRLPAGGRGEDRRRGDRAQRRDPGRRLPAGALRLYSLLFRTHDPFHLLLLAATAAVLALVIVLAVAGVSMAVCLLVLVLAPVVTVVGYETLGHRHVADALSRL